MLQPGDEEVNLDNLTDEFASYFAREYLPKILITTVDKPRGSTIRFCRELELVLPNAEFHYRNYAHIKKTVPQAVEKGFTDFLGTYPLVSFPKPNVYDGSFVLNVAYVSECKMNTLVKKKV